MHTNPYESPQPVCEPAPRHRTLWEEMNGNNDFYIAAKDLTICGLFGGNAVLANVQAIAKRSDLIDPSTAEVFAVVFSAGFLWHLTLLVIRIRKMLRQSSGKGG